MTAPQSPSSPKRVNHHDHRAAMDDSPTKRRRRGGDEDGLTTPPPLPSTSSAIAGPSTLSSSPRRRSPRLMQRVADQTQADSSGPFDATDTRMAGPVRRPAQASASSSASVSTSHSSPIMPLRSRTAPGPRRSAGNLGLESETGCRRPTAAEAPTMRPPPRSASNGSFGRSGAPSDPPSSSPSSLFSRRPLGEMTLADADRQARAIRSRHEEVEERREAVAEAAQQQATTMGSSDYPPATPSRSPATVTRRTFSLGRRSTPRRTASSSSSSVGLAGSSVARRGLLPSTPRVAFGASSDALTEDVSFSTSSVFDDSIASTTSTSAMDGMPSTPRNGQPLLGVAGMAAAARYHAHAPSSPSGAPRTPSRRRGQATSGAADQAQLESPPSDENDDSPGRERRRRREAAAAVAAMAAEKARHEEEGGEGEGEGEGGEPVLLEKGDYREVVAGRAIRGGSLVGGSR